eukprot:scaffold5530_cov283-Chaetoceros_neogracile.AAC.20
MTDLSPGLKTNAKADDFPLENGADPNTNSHDVSSITQKSVPLQDTKDRQKDCKLQAFKYTTSFKIWPIQNQAFQDVDQLSLKAMETKLPITSTLLDCSILWSKKPRLFALEYNNEGKRKYISAHLGRFINFYWRECNAQDRHYYELIREKTPCRLYFDIEYNKRANPGIDDETNETLMKEFIEELTIEVKDRFDLSIGRSNIVDLDSSTAKKFSRHLIVHMPDGELFEDAVRCGVFVKSFIGRLAEEVATKVMEKKCRTTLSKYIFIFAKEASITESEGGEENCHRQKTCFVDTGVYTRNRIFRILGSKKFGKPLSAVLRIARLNEFPFPETFTNACFYQNLEDIDEIDDDGVGSDANQHKIDWHAYAKALVDTLVIPCNEDRETIILNVNDPNQQTLKTVPVDPSAHDQSLDSKPKCSRSYANSIVQSPFPVLDNFVKRKLANWKGHNGSIRSWSINDQVTISSATITYQIKNNRWCENIQRCHKSNNVMWHVSIAECQYWQSCFDPDCRMSSYGMERSDLPIDVKKAINEDLIALEVQVSDSFEKALLDLTIDEGFEINSKDPYVLDDESFEKALLDLNSSDTEVTGDGNDINGKENNLHSSFAVDADFEKALMGLNLDDDKDELSDESKKDGAS